MMESLAVGSTVRETYTILAKLGEGAFSEVFLVRHRFLGLQAMKVFKTNSLTPTSDQFREAFILSRIAHANIIRIFEANKISTSGGERSYVTMEHAAGGTLYSFLLSRPQLSVRAAVRIQKQICAGLAVAHSQNPAIVHRDVKPQNILLTETAPQPLVKIADFGLAKNIDPRLRMASAAGTLLYMPPEGFHHYETAASDVYSAGIIFYELLTGTFPFPMVNYTTEQEFRLGLARTRTVLPAPPSHVIRGIDASCDEISLRSLEPDLSKRFQSASEFLMALESLEKATAKSERITDAPDTRSAEIKAQKAIEIGQQYSELSRAIELLEEALTEAPTLSQQYGGVLAKWKSGVVL
jgi:eukaryotic-like serine/threonine-protein kinase